MTKPSAAGERVLALALLLHLHRLELKSSEGRRQFEETADGRRSVFGAEKPREKVTMAENKIGPNLQAGAGLIAKRFQKSLNRAQEKVCQKKNVIVCVYPLEL